MDLPKRIVRFYRSGRKFAHDTEGWESATWILVDDLCEAATPLIAFSSQADVLRELDNLITESGSSESLGKYQEATLRKLTSTRRYLLQRNEPKVSREDVEQLGVAWEWETDSELQGMKAGFSAIEEKAKTSLLKRKIDARTFYEGALDSARAATFLREAGDAWLQRMHTAFPFLAQPNYECVKVELEGPFQNVVTFEAPRFQLLINSRAEKHFTPAHLNFLALHEICGHIQHFTVLKASRELQTNAPHLLCLAIHTHEALWVEGLAQIIAMYLAQQHGSEFPEVLAQVMKMNLMLAVRQNNLLQLIGGNLDLDSAARRHVEFLGGTPEEARNIYLARLKTRFSALNAFGYHSGVKKYQSFLKVAPQLQSKKLASLLSEYPPTTSLE